MKKGRERLRGFLTGLVLLVSAVAPGCERIRERFDEKAAPPATQATPPVESVHLFFGNPSGANENDADNYLLIGDGSVISYNNSRGSANWVSWRTVKSDLGPSLARPDFRPDPRLPSWFARVGHSDYSGSGYDRGHLVPSADRFGDPVLNEETFLMSNIVPQTPELNQYPWEKLESFARGQARRGYDVYQIAGVYGTKEVLKGNVAVPANCWKIIIVMRGGRTDISERTRVIAVDMPNDGGIEQMGWERFKTSIRAIEERTGYDFLLNLPSEVQDAVETRVEMVSY